VDLDHLGQISHNDKLDEVRDALEGQGAKSVHLILSEMKNIIIKIKFDNTVSSIYSYSKFTKFTYIKIVFYFRGWQI